MNKSMLAEQLNRLSELDPASVEAIGAIISERIRQIEVEGWSLDHDQAHDQDELACAAAVYILADSHRKPTSEYRDEDELDDEVMRLWPDWSWHKDWFKPGTHRRNCEKAGALLIADMGRNARIEHAALSRSTPEAP